MAINYKLTPLSIIFYDDIISKYIKKQTLHYKLKIVVNLIFIN